MPSGTHQVVVGLPIESVWNFVQDLDRWVPLVPGYIQHERINESQLTWEFYVNWGILKKKISLLVTITEWVEPTKITFDLKELKEKFAGNGYFEAERLDGSHTKMVGFLCIEAEGVMAKVVNGILNSSIPSVAEGLTDAIAERIK